MKIFAAVLMLLAAGQMVFAQNYKYIDSVKVIGQKKYKSYLKTDPNNKLVDIKKKVPGVVLDIRYATKNNFTHQQVYPQAKAFARLPVVNALQQVQAALSPKGLGLKIYDAYRPYAITVKFYEIALDTNFVADPRKGSRHNRGCAIDLTLIDLETGKELDMPTGYDSFSKEAAADYADLPPQKLANREILRAVMEANGFKIYRTEWWHYDFNGWESFALMDIPFNKL